MDKLQLAMHVRTTIADMVSMNRDASMETLSDWDFYQQQRRIWLEKLVLFSGALATLIIDETRPPGRKLLDLVPTDKENKT